MPQIVAAVVAKSAMAAPAAAATVAPTVAAAGTAAAQTAALEAAKQAAIQAGMKQAGVQAGKTAALEASKKGVIDASMKQMAQQAGKQAGVEASKQGIAQGFQKMIPQAADDIAAQVGSSGYYNPATTSVPYGSPTPLAPATTPAPAGAPNLDALKAQAIQSGSPQFSQAQIIKSGSPVAPESKLLAEQASRMPPAGENFSGIKMTPDKAFGPQSSGTYKGIDPETGQAFETLSRPSFTSPTGDGSGLKLSDTLRQSLSQPQPESPLAKGAREAVDWMGKNKMETGLGLMTVGQLMNQPKQGGEDKNKYKNTVDMSEFQPSIASVEPFTPSYEYQKYAAEGGLMKYAVGGPIETMSAQNAVGGNMMYPQAGLQTGLYSNPMIQRPEPVNVIAASGEPAVGAYSGEAKFASGGLSAAERREYGLQTRSQRASRSLTKSYEEMEKEREKELMNLLSERSDPGIIPRSRRQQLGFNPFATAAADYAGLAKKNKVPVAAMPKTSLGDIETYMDVPIEAAGGGIMHGLGGYSDGGRLLRGPGDGVSDSIPAVIGKRQPARLADGEFVIPARIVSELGNGSTEAGARKLYAMMERVQKSRKKSIGKKKVAVNSKADKHLPA